MIDERFDGFDKLSKFFLLKACFDKGMAVMNYFTKGLMVVGVGAVVQDYSLNYVVIATFLYAFLMLILGYVWIKYRFSDRESEIGNRINPFQRQLREKLKIKNTFK